MIPLNSRILWSTSSMNSADPNGATKSNLTSARPPVAGTAADWVGVAGARVGTTVGASVGAATAAPAPPTMIEEKVAVANGIAGAAVTGGEVG